jgi:hypothetical protein
MLSFVSTRVEHIAAFQQVKAGKTRHCSMRYSSLFSLQALSDVDRARHLSGTFPDGLPAASSARDSQGQIVVRPCAQLNEAESQCRRAGEIKSYGDKSRSPRAYVFQHRSSRSSSLDVRQFDCQIEHTTHRSPAQSVGKPSIVGAILNVRTGMITHPFHDVDTSGCQVLAWNSGRVHLTRNGSRKGGLRPRRTRMRPKLLHHEATAATTQGTRPHGRRARSSHPQASTPARTSCRIPLSTSGRTHTQCNKLSTACVELAVRKTYINLRTLRSWLPPTGLVSCRTILTLKIA